VNAPVVGHRSEPAMITNSGRSPHGKSFWGVQGPFLLLSVVILVNSIAIAYAFQRLSEVSDTIRWVLAPAAAAVAARPSIGLGEPVGTLSVELFSDFSCVHCRASAPAVDSARHNFGDKVNWRYRHVSRGPRLDSVGFRAALIATCLPADEGVWPLYGLLSEKVEWSHAALDIAVAQLALDPSELERCVRSADAAHRIWIDVFYAAGRGVEATPTIVVRGARIEGRLTFAALVEFLEANRNAHGTSRPPT
jgi:protein-disulfide isomerase